MNKVIEKEGVGFYIGFENKKFVCGFIGDSVELVGVAICMTFVALCFVGLIEHCLKLIY